MGAIKTTRLYSAVYEFISVMGLPKQSTDGTGSPGQNFLRLSTFPCSITIAWMWEGIVCGFELGVSMGGTASIGFRFIATVSPTNERW